MATPSTTTPTPPSTNTAGQIRQSLRPWLNDFLSLSSLSIPISFPEVSSRIQNNLYTFRANYLLIALFIFLLTLIRHPITLILFLIITVASIYLVFSRDEPLVVFDFEISQQLLLILLSVVTFVAVAVTGIWSEIILSVLITAIVVCLHAILRTPDEMESPYGALLSVVDEEDSASRGPYTLV